MKIVRIALGLLALAIAFCVSPAGAANRFWNPYIVTGAVSGTGSVCRLTISPAITGSGLLAGDSVAVTGITGATACNVTATVSTVVDSTHIELTGTTFALAYVSGGCAAGGEWTATNTSNWAASSTATCGSGGQTVPGSADAVTFDANSLLSTVTVNFGGAITIGGLTTTNFPTGSTFDNSVNNNNFTIGGLSLGWQNGAAGARTFKLGSATYTLTDTNGTIWNWSSFNGTLTPGTSTIVFSATAIGQRGFIGGANQTYNNFTVSNAAQNAGLVALAGSGTTLTFNNLTFTNVLQVTFPSNFTTVITGTFSYSGSSSLYGSITTTGGSTGSLGSTISVANATTLQNLYMQNIFAQTGAGSIACNPCINGGNNTTSGTFTITPPSGGGGGRIIGG